MADEFQNKIVVRVAAREFWLDGELICPCCPIFIETEDRRAWKVFYDDERCAWKIEPSNLEFPTIGSSMGEGEMKWFDVELRGGSQLVGRRVLRFEAKHDEGETAAGTLRFDGPLTLAVTHKFDTERSDYSVTEDC
jgi:hypothetical protein